jgi:hypothetical protein
MEKTDIVTFLGQAGWGNAVREPLAGDASHRHYERLTDVDGRTAILMLDPSPDNVRRYLHVMGILQDEPCSVPEILAGKPEKGLLLLEDFGDPIATLLSENPAEEPKYYQLAVDFLAGLGNRRPPDGLPYFSSSYILEQNDLFLDCYAADRLGCSLSGEARMFYQQIWHEIMSVLDGQPEGLLLRDFHAENLFVLPGRTGIAQLGLIDFQDAMTGPAAYDLVSLLQDARRDVSPELEKQMIARYVDKTGVNANSFQAAYSLLGAHRAMRILGVFTRLSQESGKVRYLAFLPRVQSHLLRNLSHPGLIALRNWLEVTLGRYMN